MQTIACRFSKLDNLKHFMIHVFLTFCDILVTACRVSQQTDEQIRTTLNKILAKQMEGRKVLKPGVQLSVDQANVIFTYLSSKTQAHLTNVQESLRTVSLNQLMGGMYSAVVHHGIFHTIFSVCNEPIFFERHPHVSYLLETAMGTLRKVMALPETFTSDTFFEMTTGIQNDMFNKTGVRKILLEMLIFGNAPSSIVTMNINNQEWIRTRFDRSFTKAEYKTSGVMKRAAACPAYSDDEEYELVTGDTWYPVPEESFFRKLFDRYGRTVKAGPSGSTYMWIIFCFHLLHIDRSFTNHVLLLACIIADFIPHYHSLDEILIVFSRELLQEHPKKMKLYTMDMHPQDWILYYLYKHGMRYSYSKKQEEDPWQSILDYVNKLRHTGLMCGGGGRKKTVKTAEKLTGTGKPRSIHRMRKNNAH